MILGNWDSLEQVLEDFATYSGNDRVPPDLEGSKILLAHYDCHEYDGSAFVLPMGAEGKLYEVNGGHCSCSGLEGQWDPEETSVQALRNRMTYGNLGFNEWVSPPESIFAAELTQVLAALEPAIPEATNG